MTVILQTFDRATQASIIDVCYVIVNASNEGCDDNGDGQIDFLDTPMGEHSIEVTQLPDGYTTLFGVYRVVVGPDALYSIVKGIVTFTQEP